MKSISGSNWAEIWKELEWVVTELKSGMGFFEGYVLNANPNTVHPLLLSLKEKAGDLSCEMSVWSSETLKSEWERKYSLEEYVSFYESGKILILHCEFQIPCDSFKLHLKLIFESPNVEIICYRDCLLEQPNERIRDALEFMRGLKTALDGEALFIGPDTLAYPESSQRWPEEWIRITE